MEITAAMAEEKAFLGSEFLTWLWYVGEKNNGEFKLSDGQTIEVWLDDMLTLESLMADSRENTLKGRSPSTSEEAKTALKTGKKVSRAKIRICKEEREWSFLVKSRQLDPAGVKLPAVLSRTDEERVLERLYLLEELDGMLADLYTGFLKLRLSAGWDEEEQAMQVWVAGRQ